LLNRPRPTQGCRVKRRRRRRKEEKEEKVEKEEEKNEEEEEMEEKKEEEEEKEEKKEEEEEKKKKHFTSVMCGAYRQERNLSLLYMYMSPGRIDTEFLPSTVATPHKTVA